ncbi:OsmC-like protein [Desulfacinum hydrothermale DSM 13146]|uniref:OsmC-like protein n=1 Tax=Desulfacinum hydrothermale DSM 13146 TaxID=1121390 RepID=A0A1W1XP31_9BACT|nr:hypothetical protein [Desulfacinum hydrothermale]SMC25624.1 OsmC-like protein [Desulfacinum hydrothermale DSM 13146]
MMGTLAVELAKRGIQSHEDVYRAEVAGDIENVDGVLKITRLKVDYHLMVNPGKEDAAKEAMKEYLIHCPSAQTVMGCIEIQDELHLTTKD